MASDDLQEFIEERLRAYDPNIDLSTGSAAQNEVVQPILRRIGPDPFTMPLEKFIGTRLVQEFPEISTDDGDGIMDTLVKPARVLLEPLVQENKRVRDNLSFRDPQTLTLTEAEALGANYFAPRERGDFARVTVRLYFTNPQNAVVTPGNYCYTGSGIRFLPTAIQSISANQMLFNKEGSYYYFDVTTIADNPGDGYNVEPSTIVGIYGMTSVVRVTNKLRAQGGLAEETAPEYVDRIEQDLTERSLVTERGILAVIRKYFPAITRAAVVGFNDPEMMRDVLQGEGIGPIVASGSQGFPVADGSGGGPSRRFSVDDALVDFTHLIGPVGLPVDGFTLTVAGSAFLSGSCLDMQVTKVIDYRTIEVDGQVFKPWYSTIPDSYWMLRRNQLTISGVAGGTELPGPNGEVTVQSDEVHIGGMTDMYIRGATVDQGVLVLEAVTDDAPLLTGTKAMRYPSGAGPYTGFKLTDLRLGTNYAMGDTAYTAIDEAKDKGLSLQLMDGDAGSYRILDVVQPTLAGDSPAIITDPAPVGYPLAQRWRLLDELDIDLSAPKETKISGGDLFTVQGNALAQIPSAPDLSVYGVGKDDLLELLTGPDQGIYTIVEDTTTNQVVVDREFTTSTASVSYRIYRKLTSESMTLPVVRIRSIDLLDTSKEPVGVTIPYADPVDVRSFDFTTPTNALMVDVRDGYVGCVGKVVADPTLVNGRWLSLYSPLWPGDGRKNIQFAGVATLGDIVDQINGAVGEHIAGILDGNRLGISPLRTQYTVKAVPPLNPVLDALDLLFDTSDGVTEFATNHIRSKTVEAGAMEWGAFTYDADFDSVQIIGSTITDFAYGPQATHANKVLQISKDFPPCINAIVRIGPRAVGRARCYFLEPTTFEVTPTTRFEAVLEDGTVLGYVPDPTIGALRLPPPPSTERAKDGSTINVAIPGGTNYGQLTSVSVDFIKKGILPGDILVVDFQPITSDLANAGPSIAGLALTTFIVKMNGTERTIVFGNDDSTDLTAVTLTGAVSQLNRVLGANVASFTSVGFLELEASYELVVIGGTSIGYFWMTFDTTYPDGASNLSPELSTGINQSGKHTVFHVSQHSLETLEPFLGGNTRQQFTVTRPATQRVGTTQMSLNKTYAGLYYADVQIVSEGSGAIYNIPAHSQMVVKGHTSLGYRVSNEHAHLSFSLLEKMHVQITPTVISVGASDDPENALQLAGQNLQLNYDWSSLVYAFQNFVSSNAERVTNENPLVRHLLPHFVRFDLVYRGGSTESTVSQKIYDYISGLDPDDVLEAVQVQNVPLTLGATSVSTPVDLVAVIHREDRTVVLEQSNDYLNTGRLAGFFTEAITVTRKTS